MTCNPLVGGERGAVLDAWHRRGGRREGGRGHHLHRDPRGAGDDAPDAFVFSVSSSLIILSK